MAPTRLISPLQHIAVQQEVPDFAAGLAAPTSAPRADTADVHGGAGVPGPAPPSPQEGEGPIFAHRALQVQATEVGQVYLVWQGAPRIIILSEEHVWLAPKAGSEPCREASW